MIKREKTREKRGELGYTRRDFIKKGVTIAEIAAVGSLVGPSILKASNKPIKIGIVYPITGPLARLGLESMRGTELCIEDQNRKGGIKGRQIIGIVRDAPNPDTAVAAIEYLKSVEKVDVAVGCYSSTITFAATAKAAANNLPFFVAPGIADSITDRKLRSVFRPSCISSDFAKYTAKMMADIISPKLGKKPEEIRVAVIHEDGLWGTEVTKFTIKYMQELNMKIIMRKEYDKESTDLSPIVLRLKDLRPDVLAHAGYDPDVALFWSQARSMKFYVPVTAGLGGGYSSREVIETIGKTSIGILQVDYTPYNSNPKYAKGIDKLEEAYKKKYKEPPFSCHSPCTYANMQVLFDVLEKASSFDVVGIERAALALEKPLGTYVTGWGAKFHPETHQNLAAPPGGFQWQRSKEGKIEAFTVYPIEGRLPGIELKYIPAPTWEEREKL